MLEIASRKCGLNIDELDIREGIIIEKKMGDEICSLSDIALESYYYSLSYV